MTRTLTAWVGTGDEEVNEIIAYFKKLGIWLPTLKENEIHTFSIEVKKVPEIMAVLEHRDYFRKDQIARWQILKFTDEGVSFYLVSRKHKDDEWQECYIFIPKENIVAIHNIDRIFLESISNACPYP